MQKKTVSFGRKALSVTTSVVMAASMCPIATFSTAVAAEADTTAASTDGFVTCASYRAAEPAPELLGLSNVATNTAWSGLGALDWGAPYYYIFGTEYNSNPNPYMVNSVANAKAGETVDTPCMVVDSTRKGGPTASLGDYTTSKVVWDLLPDVILGNNKNVNYNSADYAQAAATAQGKTGYQTYGTDGNGGVIYDSTNVYTMIDSMYNLASAGEAAATATGKSLRYGDATPIAQDYELYVRGTQGYVLQQLAANKAEKKTVALVKNYDAATGKYTLVQTGYAEGTAAANRYLEATQAVATNIADDMADPTVSSDDLAKVDLILVGSQAGSEVLSDTETIVQSMSADMQKKCFYVNSSNGSAGSCYGVVMNSVENAQNIGRILTCLYPEYLDQSDWIAYYYQNFYHLKTGSLAEVIANAMDGVRNWNNTGTEALAWEESDVADYNEASVVAKITAGAEYLKANESTIYTYLKLTDKVAGTEEVDRMVDTSSLTESNYTADQWKAIQAAATAAKEAAAKADATATQKAIDTFTELVAADKDHSVDILFATNPCGDQYYTGSAITPYANSFKVKASTGTIRLSEGKDYTVTYENNIEKGTATATITGIGDYKGTTKVTFDIIEYTFTVKSGENTVATIPASQLQLWAEQATDNTEAAEFQYGTTVVYVPAKQYVTADTLMKNIGASDWTEVTFAASDGFSYKVTKEANDNGKWYPAQTTDAYSTEGAVAVPAVLAFNYGTAAISDTAANAAKSAEAKAYGSWPRLFLGATEADYSAGKIAGNRFVTDVCSADVTATFAADQFADELGDNWYTESAKTAVDLGLIEGVDQPDGTKAFAADKTLTRAQVVTMLWRYYAPADAKAYDSVQATTKNTTGMSDVNDYAWYTGAANWAVKNGVLSGKDQADGSKLFDPNGEITREQLCAIVANAAQKYAGATVEGADRTKFNAMPDASSVDTWAIDSVAWSLNNGVISGKGDKYIAPLDIVTRAEASAILVSSIQGGLLYQETEQPQ